MIDERKVYVCIKTHVLVRSARSELNLHLGESNETLVLDPEDLITFYVSEPINGDDLYKLWGNYTDVKWYWKEALQ